MARFFRHVGRVRRAACLAVVAGLAATAFATRADAIMYEGTPDLPLTTSMVVAGGGPGHFSSVKLYHVLTGPLADAEATKLTNQFGAADVKTTFAVFDYAVDDTVRIVTEKHIALPAPAPSPTDGHALGLALYAAGVTPSGKWDVGYMLEHLITHPIHHTIMHDMDAKFGPENNATFHIVLYQMMHDLAMADRPAAR